MECPTPLYWLIISGLSMSYLLNPFESCASDFDPGVYLYLITWTHIWLQLQIVSFSNIGVTQVQEQMQSNAPERKETEPCQQQSMKDKSLKTHKPENT